MELQFKKVGKRWVAEFEATGNFNLNIERVEPSKIKIYQKGSEEGEYASSASWEINYAPSVVDNDFSALIYPKFIKVVSESEPIQAIVTIESESGGSGSGGGLRPVTAEDVDIMFLTALGEEVQPFSDVITVPANIRLGVFNNKSGKELYFGQHTVLLVIGKDGAGYYINSVSYERTITLDIYVKD